MRVYRGTAWLAAAALALCLLPGCGSKQPAEWKIIASPGEPIMGMDNTHAAAAAWLARYHGADEGDRTEKQFVAAMRLHIGVPECPSCPLLTAWDIESGLKQYFIAKDRPDVQTREMYLHPRLGAEPASFEEYAQEIDAGRPVILTPSYYEPDKTDPRIARLRVTRCFSVVGIGYSRHQGRDYFICHDGLKEHLEDDIDAFDRVGPLTAGLQDVKGPWDQPGTSIYRWDGDYQNLTMVLFEP